MAAIEDCTTSIAEISFVEEYSYFTLSKLKELAEKSPAEILQFITNKRSEFLSLLKESTQQELLSLAIIVLGLICTTETNPLENFNYFLIAMTSIMDSITVNLQRWLVSCYKGKKLGKCDLDALFHLTVFLKTFQSKLPSSSFDSVSILLPLLTPTCDKCLKGDEELRTSVSKQLNEIKEEQKLFFELYTAVEIKRESEKEKLHLLEPPENFRSLPILPTPDDIDLPCSFLRPNIAKGRYKDTEHYLDVQFRLLREDYIRPLRNGVAEFLSIKKKKKSLKNYKNIHVYDNVYIKSEQFVDGELMHVLKFRDANFTKIKWENSKRLMWGNLLCLSADDFRNMIFATVVKKDTKELRKGLLMVKFEETNGTILSLKSTVKFLVIETSALFESYRHNLKVLQALDAESMSMKRYIVDVEKTVNSPRYLESTTTYDMTPLLLPINHKLSRVDKLLMGKVPMDVIDKCKSVRVTDDKNWPTTSMLNLDDSQYMALKLAITKEFSIIQGPPGTGKTYIGLRTVQLLLYNIGKWFLTDSGSLPILIACNTNHALHQFLEGISKFTNKIVRIGGRISNEKIAKFHIRNRVNFVKNQESYFRLGMSQSVFDKRKVANCKIHDLKKKINAVNDYMEYSMKHVLDEIRLQKYISPAQLTYLGVFSKDEEEYWENINMYEWLGITTTEEIYYGEESDSDKICNKDVCNINVEVESEDEADVEFIENQRNIDFYDFDDAHVLKTNSLLVEEPTKSTDQNWTSQTKSKTKLARYIGENLRNCTPMAREHALKIENVWTLSFPERWQLYKFWVENFIEEKRQEYVHLQQELRVAMDENAKARIEEDLYALKGVQVLGMTTTGAAKYRHIIDAMNPVILIVEEAAEILESHVITSLAPKTQHVILIGDQQQLRPSPTVYTLAVEYGMNISLFERMINNGMDYCRLSVQQRMRPEIAALIVPHIYPHLKNHKAVTEFEHIKGISKDVFFINHNFNELLVKDSKSKVNDHEARFIVRLCRYLLQQGYKRSQITVLTTYSGQLSVLRKLAIEQGLITKIPQKKRPNFNQKVPDVAAESIRFTVVDNFQGEENDIILLSFVRSNNKGDVGFLKVSNRICVALSRAKKGLYCIGNFELLAQKSKLWKNITQTLNEMHSIGQSLCLKCQNHPDSITEVKTDSDFHLVPLGGCNHKCEYRLKCGHSCVLSCHPFDRSHMNIRCTKPCIKTCKDGHQCPKKCFEDCGPCGTLIDRLRKLCGHTVNAPCGEDEKDITCENPCKEICSRGHSCSKRCFEPCFCEILVDKICSKCGFSWKVPCENLSHAECENSCNKNCNNGHPCQKKCSEICYCDVMIEKILKSCGHTVTAPCGEPECRIKCKSQCKKILTCLHQCKNKCLEPCVIRCREKTQTLLPACGHSIETECYMKYYLFKLYKKCTEPCKILLSCGHTCKGTCCRCKQGKAHIECEETCKKILLCGHECVEKCSKPCVVKCQQITNIQSPVCGHSVKIECFMSNNQDKLSIRCREPCKEVLPCDHKCKGFCGVCKRRQAHIKCMEACNKTLLCGHGCVKKCGEPCDVKCMQMTQIQSSVCKHLLSIECCLANKLDKLSERCSEPCNEVLLCGHTCKGSCSSCYQGRIHVACQENCERILICGHKCEFKCSTSCPPCEKPCENWCSHRKCPRKCGSPCVKCNQFCEWHCSHKKCSRRCNEVCDRVPCNEPCMNKLPCNHSCIGFCGEPCPKQCSICDSEGFLEACRDPENDDFTGYVCLEDCNHIFKEEDLSKWLTASSNDMHEIRLKTCPTCDAVIRKNLRFDIIIKTCWAEVEKIKHATKQNKNISLEIQNGLLKVMNDSQTNINVLYKPIIDVLSSRHPINMHILTNLENIIKFSEEIERKNCDSYSTIKSDLGKSLLDFSYSCRKRLRSFILRNFLTVSEFQLLQLSRETYRLSLIEFVLKFTSEKNFTLPSLEFEECAVYLTVHKPFTDDSIKYFETAFEKLVENSSGSEKRHPMYHSVLKVINLSGYWYQCSKEHINCISRCTEAIQDICCECNKKSDERHAVTTGFRKSNRRNKKDSQSNDATCRSENLPLGTYSSYKSLPSCSTMASGNSSSSVQFLQNSDSSQQPDTLPRHFRSKKSKAKRSSERKRYGQGKQVNKDYRNANNERYSNQQIVLGTDNDTASEYRGGHRRKRRSKDYRAQLNLSKQTDIGKQFQEHSKKSEEENSKEIQTSLAENSASAQ